MWPFARKAQPDTDIGHILVKMGALQEPQLAQARKEKSDHASAHTDTRLGAVLVDLGFITRRQLEVALDFQRRLRKGKKVEVMAEILERRIHNLSKSTGFRMPKKSTQPN